VRVAVCGPVDLTLLSPRLRGARPASPGYAVPLISRFVDHLLDRGHEVDVVTLSKDRRDVGRFEGDRLRLVVGPMRARRGWIDGFREERNSVTAAVRASSAEVVHAHWTYEFALGALRAGRPTVVSLHDWAPTVLRHRPDHYRLFRMLMQFRTIRKRACFTANSPYLAALASRWTRQPVEVVANGFVFPPGLPDRPDVPGPPVVLSIANGFGRRKNVDRLIEALPVLRNSVPDAVLRLVGQDFEPDGAAHRWAARRGLLDAVEFVGPVPAQAVVGMLAEASVLVHPALEESFGLVLLEAVGAGTPVVAGRDSGAVPWVLGNGRAGRLVDVRSPDSIATAVADLLHDPVAASRLARQAFTDCSERFSMDRMVEGFEREYRAACGR